MSFHRGKYVVEKSNNIFLHSLKKREFLDLRFKAESRDISIS